MSGLISCPPQPSEVETSTSISASLWKKRPRDVKPPALDHTAQKHVAESEPRPLGSTASPRVPARCHLSTRLPSRKCTFVDKQAESQREALLSPGLWGSQPGWGTGRRDRTSGGGHSSPQGSRPRRGLGGGSWVINFNHCLEIGPPGGKSEAATCN